MKDPCAGCALTNGASANREPNNALLAQICVLSGNPFWCSHGIDPTGKAEFFFVTRDGHTTSLSKDGPVTLPTCAGWRRDVAKLAKIGHYKRHGGLLKQVGRFAMDSLKGFLRSAEGTEPKQECQRNLRTAILWLKELRGKG